MKKRIGLILIAVAFVCTFAFALILPSITQNAFAAGGKGDKGKVTTSDSTGSRQPKIVQIKANEKAAPTKTPVKK